MIRISTIKNREETKNKEANKKIIVEINKQMLNIMELNGMGWNGIIVKGENVPNGSRASFPRELICQLE